MKSKILLGALATVCAGSAEAAVLSVTYENPIDFEQYEIGDITSYGVIGFDSTPGIGKYAIIDRPGERVEIGNISGYRYWQDVFHYQAERYLIGYDYRMPVGGQLCCGGDPPPPNQWLKRGGTIDTRFPVHFDNLVFMNRVVLVPEPSTWAMLILGLGAVGLALRSATRASHRLEAAL